MHKKFTIKPYVIDGLTSAEAEVESPYGRIRSSWKKDADGGLNLNVTIPANTTASVSVPAANTESVTEGGKPASQAAGLKFLMMENGAALFEAGAGEYAFVAK